jgi:hypothetical protein
MQMFDPRKAFVFVDKEENSPSAVRNHRKPPVETLSFLWETPQSGSPEIETGGPNRRNLPIHSEFTRLRRPRLHSRNPAPLFPFSLVPYRGPRRVYSLGWLPGSPASGSLLAGVACSLSF